MSINEKKNLEKQTATKFGSFDVISRLLTFAVDPYKLSKRRFALLLIFVLCIGIE